MKNKEKYAKEIVEIACDGDYFGMDKRTGKITSCDYIPCRNCVFNEDMDCDKTKRDWAEQDIEKQVISKRDAMFLEYLKEENKYIARDENGRLFIYNEEPCKDGVHWTLGDSIGDWFRLNRRFNIDFPMVKWEDSEPWLIEDLKKLEVVDSYE